MCNSLKGRAFDDLTIQGQSQAALADFKTGFLQMLPTMAQSLESLHQVARELLKMGQYELKHDFCNCG
jgi:hypothetical protein